MRLAHINQTKSDQLSVNKIGPEWIRPVQTGALVEGIGVVGVSMRAPAVERAPSVNAHRAACLTCVRYALALVQV